MVFRKLVLLFLVFAWPTAVAAEKLLHFSDLRPFSIFKRPDGLCIAAAHAFNQDTFVLYQRRNTFYLVLINPTFEIPPGKYPLAISMAGSSIVPRDERTGVGIVEPGKSQFISIELDDSQVRNLVKASLVTVNLANKDHLLFLSDTAAAIRELQLCQANSIDPLKSAR